MEGGAERRWEANRIVMELPGIIEFCDEQRVRVPSAKRTEYEEQPSLLAIGCSSYSYSAQRYSYSLAVPAFLGIPRFSVPSMIESSLCNRM